MKKIISYTTNRMGTSLTESNLTHFLNGEEKPTYFMLTKKQLKALKGSKIKVDVPRAKYICSFQKMLDGYKQFEAVIKEV